MTTTGTLNRGGISASSGNARTAPEQDPEDRVANRHLRLLDAKQTDRSGRSLEQGEESNPRRKLGKLLLYH